MTSDAKSSQALKLLLQLLGSLALKEASHHAMTTLKHPHGKTRMKSKWDPRPTASHVNEPFQPSHTSTWLLPQLTYNSNWLRNPKKELASQALPEFLTDITRENKWYPCFKPLNFVWFLTQNKLNALSWKKNYFKKFVSPNI